MRGELRRDDPLSDDPRRDDPLAIPPPEHGRRFVGERAVRLGDVDPAGRLRLDAVARYLQDVANDDATDADLPNATGWVVRRTTIAVAERARFRERLMLTTFCSGFGAGWAERRTTIRGERGARLEAVALWAHIDLRTARPARIGAAFHERYGAAHGGRSVSARLTHGDPPADAVARARPFPLRAVDLDLMGHVNNAVYWAIVEDRLAGDERLRRPHRVEVEHRRALGAGGTPEVVIAEVGGGVGLWVLDQSAVAASARLAAVESASTW